MSRVLFVGLLLTMTGGMGIHSLEGAERARQAQGTDLTDEFLLRHQLHPVVEKLARGTGNLFFGWMEVPLTIQKRYSTTDAATSLLNGTAIGAVKGVVRTGVGAYEILTFWLPYPPRYAPILPTLDYFKRSERRQPLLLE